MILLRHTAIKRESTHFAFTLIEIITAMAVMMVICILLVQILRITTSAITSRTATSDVMRDVRATLDRMQLDWKNRPSRSDLPTFFGTASSNAAMSFYSTVNGLNGDRRISTVSYKIADSASTHPFHLVRAAEASTWNAQATPVIFGTTVPTAQSSSYQVASETIFRLELSFQLKKTGKIVASPPLSSDDIGAVIVSVAALDKNTLKNLTTEQLNLLTGRLGGATDGNIPAAQWTSSLNTITAGLPLPIIQHLYVCQRSLSVD